MESRKHEYDAVHLGDDEPRPSTDLEESLTGDDAEWQRANRRPARRGCMARWQGRGWLVNTVLSLVIVALLVRDQLRQPPLNPYDFNSDMTGFEPKFSAQITKFSPDESFAPNDTSKFFTQETLDKWNALMPKGMGFQWVKDPSKYHDLPTPVDWTDDMTVYTTSITHQLHCLYAMVQTYSGIVSGHEIPGDHHWHMIHCFDYLRQSIMCCADTALEGHETTSPLFEGGSDGWDAKHVCKDYNQVLTYLESVRAYDDQTIY